MNAEHPSPDLLDYTPLPADLRAPMQAWIEHGTRPTDALLESCLLADLTAAMALCERQPRRVWLIARWLYSRAPSGCHGDAQRVADWQARGGRAGIQSAQTALQGAGQAGQP